MKGRYSHTPPPIKSLHNTALLRFYDALTGPTVWVNTTDYGHIDCLDDGPYNLAAGVHLCATNRDMDRDVYRDYLAGQQLIEHLLCNDLT